MNDYRIYFVGSEAEVAHQAAPLAPHLKLEIVAPERVTDVARTGDLAIFYSEHFHRFRNAWYQLHCRGCLTLYAIDGILEWRNAWENQPNEPACPWTMRPVLSQKAASIGASQAAVLDSWGNRGKTEIVGLPRLDGWLSARAAAPKPRARSERPFRILVATAKWPAFTDEQMRLVRQSLADLRNASLAKAAIQGRAVEWVWRLTSGLAGELGVENTLNELGGAEIRTLLDQVDAVITTPSTLMLESMLAGIPTALLDYTNSPPYVPAAWSITARGHIDPVLAQLMAPSASRLEMQEWLLREALQIQEPAAERMERLVTGMIRHAHDCRAAKRPVTFPRRMLDSPESPLESDGGPVAPVGQEFVSDSGLPEFQALASENRRQLQVLQARVELLETELERAAEGFRRIAGHPILGPLLKVRETTIRFGSQIGNVLSRTREEGRENTADRSSAETQAAGPGSGAEEPA